jgi:hypothetical protein
LPEMVSADDVPLILSLPLVPLIIAMAAPLSLVFAARHACHRDSCVPSNVINLLFN